MRLSPYRHIDCGHWRNELVLLTRVHLGLWSTAPPYDWCGRQVKCEVQSPPREVFFDHHGLRRPGAVVCCPHRAGGTWRRCIEVGGVGNCHLKNVQRLFPEVTLQWKGDDCDCRKNNYISWKQLSKFSRYFTLYIIIKPWQDIVAVNLSYQSFFIIKDIHLQILGYCLECIILKVPHGWRWEVR